MTRRLSTRRASFVLLAAAVIVSAVPSVTYAWKMETHVWIAQQVLNELATVSQDGTRCWVTLPIRTRNTDGTYTIASQKYLVEQTTCESILQHQSEFRMGAIGPDAFPDLIGGQLTTHPGVPGGWGTDKWLAHVLNGAARPRTGETSPSRAFAYGFMTHAASDVFAHSYVNSYSGNIFDLGSGSSSHEVERRHVLLEGYVLQHQPPLVDAGNHGLGGFADVVGIGTDDELARVLAERLILNSGVADQYRQLAGTRHLALMYDHWKALGDAIASIEQAQDAVSAEIGRVQGVLDSIEEQIDDATSATVTILGRTIRIYPASCFLDPSICVTVLSLQASLAAPRATLNALLAANDLTATSVIAPVKAWQGQVELAVREYIKTSARIAQSMMTANPPADRTVKALLSNWLCTYGSAFGGPVPTQLTGQACKLNEYFSSFSTAVDNLSKQYPTMAMLIDPLGTLKDSLLRSLNIEATWTQLASSLLDDEALVTTLTALRQSSVDRSTLNSEFGEDNSNSGLMFFAAPGQEAADLVDQDIHVSAENQTFNADQFNAMYDAVILSKLALLGPSELSRLAINNGVVVSIYGDTLYRPLPAIEGRAPAFNILLEAVRSIDGNQQWQQFGLPYPRFSGVDDSAHEYGYPFNPDTRTGGFRLWQDCDARPNVFEALFKGPVAPALSPLVSWTGWESDLNPFPASPFSPDEPPKLIPISNSLPVLLCGVAARGTYVVDPTFQPTPASDDVAPTIAPPPDRQIECRQFGVVSRFNEQFDPGDAVAVDDRDDELLITNDAPLDVQVGTLAEISVHWTARDKAGNEGYATQMIRVVDRSAPTFQGADPQDGSLKLPAVTGLIATSPDGLHLTLTPPSAFDACDGTVTPGPVSARVFIGTRSGIAGDDWTSRHTYIPLPLETTLPIGRSVVLWLAQDQSGNQVVAAQELIVKTLDGDLVVDGIIDQNDVNALLSDEQFGQRILPDADANHDGQIDDQEAALNQLIIDGDPDPRDLNHDGVIDVLDVRALVKLWGPFDAVEPSVSCPAEITVPNSPGLATAAVTYAVPTATDNYPGVLVSSIPPPGSTFPLGSTTVNVTAVDAMGNTSRCSFQVTVGDVEPPVVSCPADIVKENDRGAAGAIVTYQATATDNAPGVSVSTTPTTGSFFPLGQTSVAATAMDGAGLTSSCSFTVTINDTEPPVIAGPTNASAEATGPAGAIVPDALLGTAVASDNSGDVKVVRSGVPAGNVFPLGTTHVRYVASDAAGNTAEALQIVKVVDTTPPLITVRGPQSMQYDIHQLVFADYACTDAASGVATCSSAAAANGSAIDTSTVGVKSFTVDATDVAGNSSSVTVTYSVSYRVCLLYGADRAVKAGSTVPIRLQLCDASGGNQSDAGIALTARGVRWISNETTLEVQDAGQANADDTFRFDGSLGGTGGYIFNLSTSGLLPGTYVLVFSVAGDPGEHASELIFRVK